MCLSTKLYLQVRDLPSLLCLALPCLIFFNYVFFSYADTCIKYYNARPGIEERISSAKTRCRHAVISQKSTWQRLWFKSINIPSGNFILVTLKSPSGNKMSWNLTSNDTSHVRNFDVDEKDDWFEIEQTANVSFDAWFMLYSASKYFLFMTPLNISKISKQLRTMH